MSATPEQTISLPELNLPPFEPVLSKSEGKLWIFDPLRKKYLVLTPEEWVRQHWINYLINHLGYPGGLFSLEKGLKYNQLQKRTDLIVFARDAQPYLLVECKAPTIKIDERTLIQAMTYNKNYNCPYLILSNGLNHTYMGYSEEMGQFIQLKRLPNFPG